MTQTKLNGPLLDLDSDLTRQQTQTAPMDPMVLTSIDYDPQSGAYHSKQISCDSLKRQPIGKSRQLNEQNSLFKDGRLVWDEQSKSLTLDGQVHLRSDKFLSVGSIESFQDQPLIIISAGGRARRAQVNLDNKSQSELSPEGVGGILISTQARPKWSSSEANTNYILLPSSSPNSAKHSNTRQPVEIVASSLILNQFVETERVPAQIELASPGDRRDHAHTESRSRKMTNHFNYAQRSDRQTDGNQFKLRSVSDGARAHSVSRRLLELDGQRQSIVVPLLNRIDLFPSSAETLFVRGEFRCQSTINGRLYENFDLQARWGNLSLESGRTLRIVSRSDKLDLAAARLISLEAPTLRLSAPKTNKLLISDGIKFFKLDDREKQASEQAIRHTLQGFKLVLIDDILMASQD